MTTDLWLKQATRQLERAGIAMARLDALVLLEDVTSIDRAKLLAEPKFALSPIQLKKLKNLLNMREQHVPLAYVRGKTEFYGRQFLITPAVLEPRPESENMIDELKNLPDLPAEPNIADVGTGSGALGITAKLELPDSRVELLDIDPQALKVAKMNVDKFTMPIKVSHGDLLQGTNQLYDVLLCNLPYVPDGYKINLAAAHEPALAIFGGPDGLSVYKKLFKQIKNISNKPLYILSEALPPQHAQLKQLAASHGYTEALKNDFIQVFRRVQN